MHSEMFTPARTENGFVLLLLMNWDRVLSAGFIALSLCLGSWLVTL
mgnify:FL=1